MIIYTNIIKYTEHYNIETRTTGQNCQEGWIQICCPFCIDDNFHLAENSPAVDAGTSVNAPAKDLDGHDRDATPDIGAYEYQEVPLTGLNIINILPVSLTLTMNSGL